MLDDVELWSVSKLGFILYTRERLPEAAAIFHGLLQLRPQWAYGWYALGLVRREQGDIRGAVENLNQAVAHDPALWAARVALAELLYTSGYKQDALAMLKPVHDADCGTDRAVRRGQTLWRCWR